MRKILSLAFIVLFGTGMLSQTCSPECKLPVLKLFAGTKDTTDQCDVLLTDGRRLKSVKFTDVYDSTFDISKYDSIPATFKIDELHKITFARHGFWKGMLIGTAAAYAAIFLYLESYKGEDGYYDFGAVLLYGAIITVPIGLITGAIFEFFTNDEAYTFGKMDMSRKRSYLNYIRHEHKN